jgi:hypothetical protein
MAPSLISAAACALAIVAPSAAFAPVSHSTRHGVSSLAATSDRRGFMGSIASSTAAIAGISSAWMAPGPALAYGVKKANEKLAR